MRLGVWTGAVRTPRGPLQGVLGGGTWPMTASWAEVIADLEREQGTALVGTIRTMAHELDLAVIAAGVETRAQGEEAQAMGCGLAQGNGYGQPMPSYAVGVRLDALAGVAPHGSLRRPRRGRRHVTAAQPQSARPVGMP